jgi:hypothetical protein
MEGSHGGAGEEGLMPEAIAVWLALCAGARQAPVAPTGEREDLGLFAELWAWALTHPFGALGVGLGMVLVLVAQHLVRQHPAPTDDPVIEGLVLGGGLLVLMGFWLSSVGVW